MAFCLYLSVYCCVHYLDLHLLTSDRTPPVVSAHSASGTRGPHPCAHTLTLRHTLPLSDTPSHPPDYATYTPADSPPTPTPTPTHGLAR
eukprot:588176-Rhodomonas_salina.1